MESKGDGPVALRDIEKAAALVFRRQGYGGSTMQQIAAEVGLHKTSLYHHITSKENLLISIAESAMDEPLAQLEQIVAESGLSPDEKLRRAVHMQVIAVTENTDQIASFTMFVHEISDEAVRRDFIERRRKYSAIFQGLVADCLGVDQKSAEAEMAAFGILGICNWMLYWYQPYLAHSPEDLATYFADMAVRSVSRA